MTQTFQLIPDPYGPKGLLAATGDDWRDMRHSLTPAFSASKMKMVIFVYIFKLILLLYMYPCDAIDGTSRKEKHRYACGKIWTKGRIWRKH